MSASILVHATAVALAGSALLLRGPPGAGKSDLALRLIDGGATLVADDQALLCRRGERILIGPPATIAGLIEVRGIGIVRLDWCEAPLGLIVDLKRDTPIVRLPEADSEMVLGLAVPRIALAPFEASAAAKLRLAQRLYATGEAPAVPGQC